MLYRASAHVISNAPLTAIMNEAKKVSVRKFVPSELVMSTFFLAIKHHLFLQLILVILEGLTPLGEEMMDKEDLYSLLLVLSGILTDTNGKINGSLIFLSLCCRQAFLVSKCYIMAELNVISFYLLINRNL